jgi:ribonuclease E
LRDVYSADVNRIVTDSPLGLKRVRQYLQSWNKGQMPAGVFVDAHRETTPLLEYFRINAVIRQALRPRVDLPSGGYIVIEPTEALTVIDVNSGSFTQSATSRETVLWTNCEAATEIARQLRLRNIAGVIVVDFIDMDLRRDQLQVLEHFNKALRSDKARPQIAQLSELGLVELTRKRQGQSLYEVFGRPCPTCDGLGLLAHLPGAHPDAPDSLISRSPATLGMEAGFARRSEDFGASPDEDLEAPFDPVASLTPSFPGRDRNGGSQRGQARPKGLRPGSGLGRRGRPMPREEFSSAGRDSADAFPFPFTGNDAADLEKPDLSEGSSLTPGGRDKILLRDKGERGKLASAEKGRGIGADSGLSAREPRQRDTHPKVITVEMTPLQQKVYSEMGLSPLLLLKAPVSVGRDTAVMVALPGSGGSATRTVSPEPSPDWQPSPGFATAAGTTDAWAPPAPSEPDISAWPPASLDLATDLPLQNPGGSVAAEGSAGEIARAHDAPAAPAEAEPKVTPEKQSPAASRRRRSQSKS